MFYHLIKFRNNLLPIIAGSSSVELIASDGIRAFAVTFLEKKIQDYLQTAII